jgi:hypothetical protein
MCPLIEDERIIHQIHTKSIHSVPEKTSCLSCHTAVDFNVLRDKRLSITVTNLVIHLSMDQIYIITIIIIIELQELVVIILYRNITSGVTSVFQTLSKVFK